MSTSPDNKYLDRLHRDNRLSVFLGPIKLVVPALSYLFLYPLILKNSSIEVLGLWSILATTVSFISITDIGFSQLLVRDAGVDKQDQLNITYRDYFSAQVLYCVVFFFILAAFLSFMDLALAELGDVYSLSALKFSIPIMIAGTFLQLASNLDAAILRARHDNYFVQFFSSIMPIITYASMIIGALLSKPIEGLAIGTLLTGATNLLLYRNRVAGRLHVFEAASCGIESALSNIPSLCRRGWLLFSVSLGLMLRAPVYRYLIAATAGLPAVAIFDMAMRVTQTARDAVATGFGVLYPSFAILVRKQQQDAIIEIIQVSLMILISVGSLSLGLVIALADPMLSLWLGSYPIDLKPAIVVLAAWQMLTLFNVPFWHLLMASGNERVAAYSVWTHTTSLLLIVPASSFFEIDTIDLLLYWSATSVLTQLLIFYFAEAVLGLFWTPLKSLRLRLALILAVVFLVGCYLASQLITDSNLLVIFVALIAALYLLLAAFSTGRPIMEYLRREQSWKQ